MSAQSAPGFSRQHWPGRALLATTYCSDVLVVISRLLLAFWPASCQSVRQNYDSEGEMSCRCDVTLALLRAMHSPVFCDRQQT